MLPPRTFLGTRRSRALVLAAVIVLLGVVFTVDGSTGAAPFQHLYYLPIVLAGIGLPFYAGPAVGVAAVVLYHLANPALRTARYRESDIVQILLFVAIGFVTAQLAEDRRRLRRLAHTDDLTGLHNLRGFEAKLMPAVGFVRQGAAPIGLLVLDVDNLKSINDTHGHVTGADAVRTVGRIIGKHLPDGAFACRFGGDEFVVALPGREFDEAGRTAQAIRDAVYTTAPTLAGRAFPSRTLSVSVGLAWQRPLDRVGSDTPTAGNGMAESLFRAADHALYAAKSAGRNQVRTA